MPCCLLEQRLTALPAQSLPGSSPFQAGRRMEGLSERGLSLALGKGLAAKKRQHKAATQEKSECKRWGFAKMKAEPSSPGHPSLRPGILTRPQWANGLRVFSAAGPHAPAS